MSQPAFLRSKARELRKAMTHEEVKLWIHLKQLNAQAFHFRRQVPLDRYIVDFAEFGHRLILEVDGSQHAMPEGEARDLRRDRYLLACGFRVMRFWNIDINTNLDGVVDTILFEMKRGPHPSRFARHLPREGEG